MAPSVVIQSLVKAMQELVWDKLKDKPYIKDDLKKGITLSLGEILDLLSVEELEDYLKGGDNTLLASINLSTCLHNVRNLDELQTYLAVVLYEAHEDGCDDASLQRMLSIYQSYQVMIREEDYVRAEAEKSPYRRMGILSRLPLVYGEELWCRPLPCDRVSCIECRCK